MASPNGEGILVHYMENFSEANAYMPRPAPMIPCGNWNNLFRHPDPRQGCPIGGEVTPITERGKRRHWRYVVRYAGGDVKDFVLACPSLPFDLTLGSLRPRICNTVRQEMHKGCTTKLRGIHSRIKEVKICIIV